jgi:hypothetical protein
MEKLRPLEFNLIQTSDSGNERLDIRPWTLSGALDSHVPLRKRYTMPLNILEAFCGC